MSDEDFETMNDEELEVMDSNVDSSSDKLQPGSRIAPGKVVGKNGKVEDSAGKKLVKGAKNAGEIAAMVGTGGASAGAEAAGTGAAKLGSAAKNTADGANLSKKLGNNSIRNIGKTATEDAEDTNILNNDTPKEKEGLLEKAENKLADKIDKTAEKNPIVGKAVEEAADKAEVLNTGMGAAKSLLSGDMEGVKDNVKGFIKSLAKEKLKKVKLILGAVFLAFFLIVVVFEMSIGPLKDAWNNLDKDARKYANNVEKISNFYSGFGFSDSKDAFYMELNSLDAFYDHKLDLALLLSTLFYPEMTGYDTKYQNHLAVIENDPITEGLSGGVDSFMKYMSAWTKDILEESKVTYDENGLEYSAGKIYRARRLAAAMCSRNGEEEEMPISEFIDNYSFLLTTSAYKAFSGVSKSLKADFIAAIRALLAALSLNFSEVKDEATQKLDETKSTAESLKTLFDVITFGLFTITGVEVGNATYTDEDGNTQSSFSINIKYIPYTVDEEQYEQYLKDYYFEDTPEYKNLLPNSPSLKENKKNKLIEEININTKVFKELYLGYSDSVSEEYNDKCEGAISNDLVSALKLPIKVADDKEITFSDEESYGVKNSVVHNGVSLTESNSGIKANDKVYSVAKGKVDSVKKGSGSTSSLSDFLFIGDSRYNGLSNYLKSYGSVFGVDSSSSENWLNVTKNGSGTVLNTNVTLPASASNVSINLGVNDLNQANLKKVMSNLHERYPNATIYVNSVYHIGTAYTGSVTNPKIDAFNKEMKNYCDKTDWAQYIDILNNLHDKDGWLKAEYTTDGLHINKTAGQLVVVNNIKNKLSSDSSDEGNGYTVIIKHKNVESNSKTYTFTTVYRNLATVNVKKGDTVKKGAEIGTVGTTDAGVPQLYFEFRNDKNDAINPTNLFIKCEDDMNSSGDGTVLAGNTDEEKIWNFLLKKGYSKVSIAGMMGNMQAESSFNSICVQGDYLKSDKIAYDTDYTNKVDKKEISEDDFVHRGPGGGGYGLAQWTYSPRKQGLYDITVKKNISIGDFNTQLIYYDYELKNLSDFKTVYQVLSTTNDVETACKKVFHDYENPENQGPTEENKRIGYCNAIYNKYKDYVAPTTSKTTSTSSGGKVNKSDSTNDYPEGTYTSSTGIKYKQYLQYGETWKDEPYSQGTYTNAGCGPTSVAILVNGNTSTNITPVDAGKLMMEHCATPTVCTGPSNIKLALEHFGMKNVEIKSSPTGDDVKNALKAGKVMAVSVNSSTIFTPRSHIMAVVDINSSGKVYVINPNSLGSKSSPSGWYDVSELTKGLQYIVTANANPKK